LRLKSAVRGIKLR